MGTCTSPRGARPSQSRPQRREGHLPFRCQRVQVEPLPAHLQAPVGGDRPLLAGFVAVELYAVLIEVAQVQRLAHTVIACAIEGDARRQHAPQGITERRTRRIENRQVIEAGAAGRWWRTPGALPGVERYVVMITP